MTDLTPDDLAAIRARAEGGTEGTWTASVTGHVWSNPGEPALVAQVGWAEDAEFIAHAREDVPALLDALDAARAGARELSDIAEREHAEAVTARADLAALREAVDDTASALDDLGPGVDGHVAARHLRAALAAPTGTEAECTLGNRCTPWPREHTCRPAPTDPKENDHG